MKAARLQQEATADILRAVATAAGDAAYALQLIAETTARLFGAHSVAIHIVENGRWARTFNVGEGSHRIAAAVLTPDGHNLPGMVFRENRQFHVPDLDNPDPAYADWPGIKPAREAGARVISGTPLRRGSEAIGVLIIHRNRLTPFTPAELALQQSFADQTAIVIENARLFKETNEALERERASAGVLKAISGSVADARPVFDQILNSIEHLYGADERMIVMLGEDERLYIEAVRGPNSERSAPLFPVTLKGSGSERAFRERRVVAYNDVYNDPDVPPGLRAYAQRFGANYAFVSAPMIWKDRSIGAILVGRTSMKAFDAKECAQLSAFADQAVIAIENARLFEEVQTKTRDLEETLAYQIATSDVLRAIGGSMADAKPVFQRIVDSLARLLEHKQVGIFLAPGDGLVHVAAFSGLNAQGLERVYPRPVEGSAIPVVLDKGRQTYFPDLLNGLDVPESLRQAAVAVGENLSNAITPMIWEGRGVGVIAVTRAAHAGFTERELGLLSTFADQAVIAIENARLFNETKEALERQTATAEILSAIGQSVSDAKPVFEKVIAACERLLATDGVSIFIAGDDGMVRAAAASGDRAEEVMTDVTPLADSITAKIIAERRLHHIPDFAAQPNLSEKMRDRVRRRGNASMLYAPMLWKDRGLGSIVVRRSPPRPFTEKEQSLLSSFADQAAIAIENARLFNETQEALERQTATGKILEVISRSPTDPKPVLDEIVLTAQRLFDCQIAGLVMTDGDRLKVETAAAGGRLMRPDELAPPMPIDAKANFPSRAVVDGKALSIDFSEVDLPEYERQLKDRYGFGSAIYLPLLRGDETIGVFVLTSSRRDVFDAKALALAESFRDQAVIAIENTRLFAEVQGKTRDLEQALAYQVATSDVLSAIGTSMADPQTVFERITEAVQRLMPQTGAGVFLMPGDGLAHLAAHRFNAAVERYYPAPITPDLASSLAVHQQLHLPSVLNSTEAAPFQREIAATIGDFSITDTAMVWEGRALGFISTARRPPQPFSERELQILKIFADQAVIAIENARLINEVQAKTRDLEESLERQQASAEILRVISSSPTDVKPVFDVIIATAIRLIGCDFGIVFRLDGDVLTPVAGADQQGRPQLGPPVPLDVDANFPSRAVVERRTLDVPDYVHIELPEFELAIRRELGVASAVFLPFLRGEECLGLLALGGRNPNAFSVDDIALAESFRDQAVIAIANTRLFEEVQAKTREAEEALERQTATSKILEVIASSPTDAGPVFQAIAASATAVVRGHSTAVLRFIEGYAHLVGYTSTTPEADAALIALWPRPVAEVTWAAQALRGESAAIEDTEVADPRIRDIARVRGYRAMLFTPLMRSGEPMGFITVTRAAPGPFAPADFAQLRAFADQAVIAIENARLFDEVQAKTRDLSEALIHQTASGNILKVIASSPTKVAPALQAIVESACEVCDAYDAAVILREGGHVRFSAHCGPIPIGLETWPLNRGWVGGRAILDRTSVHVPDLQLAGDEFPDGRDFALRMGHRTILAAPLMRETDSVGAIVVRRKEAHPFSEKQIELLRSFADQAVIAIGNVRLFDEVQARTRDLEESLAQQTATADVLKVISRSVFDLDNVLRTLIDTAVRLCRGSRGTIFLRNGDWIEGRAFHSNVPPALRDYILANPIPLDAHDGPPGSIATAIREGRIVHNPDLVADRAAVGEHIRSLATFGAALYVPLMRDGKAIGCFGVPRHEALAFTEREIELAKTFADQAVIAIENARLFNEVQARTRDLEESLAQQTATADVLKVISRSAFDLQKVLDTLIGSAVALSGADNGLIYIQRNDAFYVGAHSDPAWEPAFVEKLRREPQRPGRGSVGARVLLTGEIVHVPDNRLDPDYDPALRAVTASRAVLGVPLKRDGAIVGAIALARRQPGLFTDRQIELAQTFADQAVIAIENARLLDEVQSRTRELEQSLDDLKKAQDRLVQTEKLASLGQLTAGIAHEIKNPLNFVNNFSALSVELAVELNDLLKGANISEEVSKEADELTSLLKDNLGKVVQHGKRADSIVKNMLLHSREGSGEHRPADVNALVDESLNLAYHGARAEKPQFNVTLKRDLDPEAGMIEAFPQEITRVLLNLISNAFYAVNKRKADMGSDFEPTVSATTRGHADRIEIRIRDNGIGIPPEVKEKVFNPFFTTKPAGEGTGLGLSMSHDIVVKQHGGTIDADTLPGEFTEFTIVLPRSSNHSNKTRG